MATRKPTDWSTVRRAGGDTGDTGDTGDVWGMRSGFGPTALPGWFAVVAGVVCLLLGVVGFFVTGVDRFTERTDALLLGLFHLTPMYDVALLGIGVLWLLTGLTLTKVAVEGVNFAMAGFFVLAAVLAHLGALPLFGIPAGFGPDVVLLVVLGVVSLLFAGLLPGRG